MTVGCSEALSHSTAALAVDGANILPRSRDSRFTKRCVTGTASSTSFGELDPENGWEIKLTTLEDWDENTVAIAGIILVIRGAVFSEKTSRAICTTCEALHLPIIADEVYEDVFFDETRPFNHRQV